MRDLVVREALEAMARDSAKRFRELVASGSEIPYDVREADDGSPLPQYTPLTERFIREQAPLLRELDSFGSTCAALEASDLAGPYLVGLDVDVPPEGRRCAETASIVFLCRLWHDSTDFSLDDERLGLAIAELQVNGDATEGEIEVVVPLRGLRMEALRVDLATASIVRADSVDVPAEARSAEASGGAGWEPTFLAITRVSRDPARPPDSEGEAGPDSGTRAVEAFRSLVTTLSLFKAGGVALGPHAWTRLGGGRWRRISTGAGRPRPGGYRLAESELGELAVFSRAMAHRLAPPATGDRSFAASPLGRSVSRFEAGLERTAAIDALNDYLLSLRFLLEGGGPADLGLSMRVASLCADPEGRGEVKATIDRALGLERELWSGEPPSGAGELTPADTAAEVEDLARAILKDAACGHLGTDLRATADEILLADGLAVGDGGERGETAEWGSAGEVEVALDADDIADREPVESAVVEARAELDEVEAPRFGREQPVAAQSELWFDGLDDDDTNDVQVIRQPDRISVHRNRDPEEESMHANSQRHDLDDQDSARTMAPALARAAEPEAEESPARRGAIGESPVGRLLELHSAEREATAARVANLFPRPETTDWDVREISYDRSRRAPSS